MATYHILFFDDDGLARRTRVLEDCEDDEQALARAAALAYRQAIEVWQSGRLVGRWSPPQA